MTVKEKSTDSHCSSMYLLSILSSPEHKVVLSQATSTRAFIFDVLHHLEVFYQFLVDNISSPL